MRTDTKQRLLASTLNQGRSTKIHTFFGKDSSNGALTTKASKEEPFGMLSM